MQASISEFFESVNDALKEAVRALGGNKQIGPLMWPTLPPEQATNKLRDCLNPERREKLSPEQVVWLLRMACAGGYHGAMGFMAFEAGYEPPRPVVPEDQETELQRAFVDAVGTLESIQKQLARVQTLRKVS